MLSDKSRLAERPSEGAAKGRAPKSNITAASAKSVTHRIAIPKDWSLFRESNSAKSVRSDLGLYEAADVGGDILSNRWTKIDTVRRVVDVKLWSDSLSIDM